MSCASEIGPARAGRACSVEVDSIAVIDLLGSRRLVPLAIGLSLGLRTVSIIVVVLILAVAGRSCFMSFFAAFATAAIVVPAATHWHSVTPRRRSCASGTGRSAYFVEACRTEVGCRRLKSCGSPGHGREKCHRRA